MMQLKRGWKLLGPFFDNLTAGEGWLCDTQAVVAPAARLGVRFVTCRAP